MPNTKTLSCSKLHLFSMCWFNVGTTDFMTQKYNWICVNIWDYTSLCVFFKHTAEIATVSQLTGGWCNLDCWYIQQMLQSLWPSLFGIHPQVDTQKRLVLLFSKQDPYRLIFTSVLMVISVEDLLPPLITRHWKGTMVFKASKS